MEYFKNKSLHLKEEDYTVVVEVEEEIAEDVAYEHLVRNGYIKRR